MNKDLIENRFLKFECTNSYSTMNNLSRKTDTIWIVCHGFGQLSKHFIRRFDILNRDKNFIIAPEGISKFYLHNTYDSVGSSWITKENKEVEIKNQKKYFDSLFHSTLSGIDFSKIKINLLGFSQGVDVILRLIYYKKIQFNKLILWAGGFPNELDRSSYSFVNNKIQIFIVIGNKDKFYNKRNIKKYYEKINKIFKVKSNQIIFEGNHEVKREIIKFIDEKY